MKVVAFVPIKLNNERLPNKNIMPFDGGNPLITYILDSLKAVKGVDDIYVYCSDASISEYLPEGVKFLERSSTLDTSQPKINEVISSFIDDVDADVYIFTHATAPFIKAENIEKGLNAVLNDNYDSSLSVKKLQDFLWENNKPYNYDPSMIPRTQDLSPMYSETSGFYIFEKHLSVEENRRVGHTPFLVEVSEIESIDIDNREDFDIANAVFNKLLNKE